MDLDPLEVDILKTKLGRAPGLIKYKVKYAKYGGIFGVFCTKLELE